jgi:WD40 repeat protein
MRRITARWLPCASLLALIVGISVIGAPEADAQGDAPKPAAPLTSETLEQFLKDSLEEPKAFAKEGQYKYWFALKRDRVVKWNNEDVNKTLTVYAHMALENSKLRLDYYWGAPPALEAFDPAMISATLGRSGKNTGAFFNISDFGSYGMSMLIDNRGLTPRIFAQELNKFFDVLVSNYETIAFTDKWFTDEESRIYHGSGRVQRVAFTPDGSKVVTCDDAGKMTVNTKPPASQLVAGTPAKDGIYGLAITPDSKKAYIGSKRGALLLVELETLKELARLEGHKHSVWSLALSPDGKLLASGGGAFQNNSNEAVDADGKPTATPDYTIRIWDTASNKELKKLDGHTKFIKALAFSADGKLLISTGEDTSIRVWDVATGKELHKFDGNKKANEGIAFLPDGKRFIAACVDRTLRLCNAETGAEVKTYTGHRAAIWAFALSRDGKLAITGSPDKTIRVWDVETGRQVKLLVGPTDDILTVGFSPSATQAISGAADGKARVWKIAP